ncbi:hypothetical protein AX17_002024 [Amanita inopinata Kibby_2008]|nr:hypothetical protein AX17_002024 [Amanita inopinata Kibby_2008]
MSRIGPEIPAHLLRQRSPEEAEDEAPAKSDNIGPQIPAHLLQKSTTPEAEEDEDEITLPLPPSMKPVGRIGPLEHASKPSTSRQPIGPTLPSQAPQRYVDYDDDDDDEIGPRPLPVGYQEEKDDAVKRFMEVEEKRRKQIEEAAKPKALKREEWMLKPPSSSDLLGSLDPTRLKARQFSRTTKPSSSKVDNSLWTETPAEKQQRLADEVVGKRRRAVDPVPEETDENKRRKKDDENIRRGVDEYTSRIRGPSLVTQHGASETEGDKDDKHVIWDHARDMSLGGRLMDDEKRNKLIKESRGLGDRFNTGKTGGFLYAGNFKKQFQTLHGVLTSFTFTHTEDMKKQAGSKFVLCGFLEWLRPALKSRRMMKTWIRCCVALAAVMILLVDNSTLRSTGQVAFLAAIVGIMLPPSMALSMYLLAASTLLFGMLVGWAWGCAAMASALSVRSQSLLAQQQQKAQASLVPNVPVAAQMLSFVYHGMFLDPRSSAVYGAFFFIGTYALGALRAFIPKLTLLSIFGTIVLNIMCSYGPLFPTARYTLAKIILVPASYYIAIAIGSLIFVFPESLNHIWITTLHTNYLAPIIGIMELQSKALSTRPSNHQEWSELAQQGSKYRQAIISSTQALVGQISMIDLEVSIGRLGPGDLKKVSAELRSLSFRASGLHAFINFVNHDNAMDASEDAPSSTLGPDRLTLVRRRIRERESLNGHDLDSFVPILSESSARLRLACEAGIKGTSDWFEDCNSQRWVKFLRLKKQTDAQVAERHDRLEALLKNLKEALDEFRRVERVKLIKPFECWFDLKTGLLKEEMKGGRSGNEMFTAQSLFICFVFIDIIDGFAERLVKVMELLVMLDSKRPVPRLWMPSGFGKLGRKIMSRRPVDGTPELLAMGTNDDPTSFPDSDSSRASSIDQDTEEDEGNSNSEDEHSEKPSSPNSSLLAENEEADCKIDMRNPDALPPTTVFGRFFVRLGSILRFLKSPEGIFALRHALLSIALWVPAVCPNTAWFYYKEKGIWALIVAQPALAVYAGDQIAGFFVRLIGVALGLLAGMAVWYIGSGNGNGNPYGIAVATTVFVAPFLLGRVASPPQDMMLWATAGLTTVFVVGFSWIDTHLTLVSNNGVGVEVGWKRALLVIIGFTAASIIMLLPPRSSTRTLVRRTLGATLRELGKIFAGDMEAFLAEEARARAGHNEKVSFIDEQKEKSVASPKEKRVRRIGQKILDVASRLRDLQVSLKTARFEPQVQGLWPHQTYARLHNAQTKLLASLFLLTTALRKLDTRWCSILVHKTPFLNPNLVSDIFSTIVILSTTLSHPRPLLASMPRLRDRLIYHHLHVAQTRPARQATGDPLVQVPSESDSDGATSSVGMEIGAGRIDGSSIGFDELTLDVLMDEQLPAHSTAVVALSDVISRIDEITLIVRELCGTITFRGFETLHRDYLGREEKVIGAGLFTEPTR